jgi:hypothetical protein
VYIDTFVPVSSSIFTRSFAVVLGLICTFHTKVSSSLRDRTRLLPERYDGCVVPWCWYLRTIVCTDECGTFRRLEISPKDEPDLWRSTIYFLRSWLIPFDLPMMSSKDALSLKVGLSLPVSVWFNYKNGVKRITFFIKPTTLELLAPHTRQLSKPDSWYKSYDSPSFCKCWILHYQVR